MSQALSTAKVQSVREITKKAKQKKINKNITKIIIWIIVIVVLFMFVKVFIIDNKLDLNNIFNSKQEFRSTENNIDFYSVDFPIRDSLLILEQDSNITISFNTNITDENYLTNIIESINLLQGVFNNKKKNTILVINTVDEQNNLLKCTSNLGDLYTSTDLNISECNNLLNKDNTLIFIDYPNENLEETKVQISVDNKIIHISPKDIQDVKISIQLILRSMYEDIEKIVNNLNNFKLNKDTNSN
jgi:hypothetical protein